MPPKLSAGLMLYRHGNQDDEIVLEVLLGHMGGPFWAKKDDGAWSIPKGEYDADEDPLACARREFAEELGAPPPQLGASAFIERGEVVQPGHKAVIAFAVQGDFD